MYDVMTGPNISASILVIFTKLPYIFRRPKMNRLYPLIFLLSTAAIAGATPSVVRPGTAHTATSGWCTDSTAADGDNLIDLKALAVSTTPSDTLARTDASLPSVSAESIWILSDTTLCRRAAESRRYARNHADTGALLPINVVHWGSSRYLSGDLPNSKSEWNGWLVFDTSFAIVGILPR